MRSAISLLIFMSAIQAFANAQSPLKCKAGYTAKAHCAALEIIGVEPKIQDAFTAALVGMSQMMFQDVLVCGKSNSKGYVVLNIPENGKNSISPEMPATFSSTGVTHTINFKTDADPNSKTILVYGGLAGPRDGSNGRLYYEYKVGKKFGRLTYSVKCNYQR